MIEINMVRYMELADSTRGFLRLPNGKYIQTLEPAWEDNATSVSCIPVGQYKTRYLPSSASGKYKDIYLLEGVSGRAGILIHKGNFRSHTRGCILPGMSVGSVGRKPAIWSSGTALSMLHQATGRDDFLLTIEEIY